MRQAGLLSLTIHDDARDKVVTIQAGGRAVALPDIELRSSEYPRLIEEQAIKQLGKKA